MITISFENTSTIFQFFFQTSEMFSTFPESLYSTANSINNSHNNGKGDEGQPIPASNIRRPFSSQERPREAAGGRQSPELLRVRSPQSLQRVAFDIATLRQPFQSTKNDTNGDAKGEDKVTKMENVATSLSSSETSLARPSSRHEITSTRTAETLVA